MGLGPLSDVSLAHARQKASEYRQMLRDGVDPLQERRRKRQEGALAASRAISFRECAEAYVAAQEPSWRNEKHVKQWRNTLATYAYPVIGHLLVSDIAVEHVEAVLRPIWNEKHETARRLRARIERVLSWATTRKYRVGDNPARWDGNLKNLLPTKTAQPQHHRALPFADMQVFMAELRQQPGVAAVALEFTILTAARTGEVLYATWDEIDFDRREWIVPAEHMKAGREHRVPLSTAAVNALKRCRSDNEYVFPGPKGPLSNMAMLMLVKRMGYEVTVHGFRSTFRDWAAERTGYPNHVLEMALAHAIPDKVEKAYRRGELLEVRARLMDDWAEFIEPEQGNVSRLRAV